jgi:Fe-S-cluster-containing dehydrogenase component
MTPRARRHLWLADATRCIGCSGCEAACALEHELPAGPRPVRVIRLGPWGDGDALTLSFQPTSCCHCERPACVLACPTGAMQKRADGIVFSDLTVCIGCQTCAVACPFGVPQLNPATGRIAKCDGCRARVDQGLWPACTLKCPTGALLFGSPIRVVNERRAAVALQEAASFEADRREPTP